MPEQSSPDQERPLGGLGVHGADLSFVDVPRLELEATLETLTRQAQAVLSAQGRLRALLRASAAMTGEVSLPTVLRRAVEAARELVSARYAALGILRDGALEAFVHSGVDEDTVAAIGDLPKGLGVLGSLVRDPAVLRLADLGKHPESVGFPEHHPPMRSFLGVPIRVHGQVFGNLYVTESARGEFSADDEHLLTALAGSVGLAVATARAFDDSEQQRRWLAAATEVTEELLAAEGEALPAVVAHAARAANADMAAVAVPAGPGRLRIAAAAGLRAADIRGVELPTADTVAGQVMAVGEPVLGRVSDDTAAASYLAGLGPVVAAPLRAHDRVLGALLVGRRAGRAAFIDTDVAPVAMFAAHAGLAIALDRSRADREVTARIEDRERIAADLHDHVIQELFATGMRLESMQSALPDRPELRARVSAVIDTLDSTIRRIRDTIFLIQPEAAVGTDALRRRVLRVVEDQTRALGFAPDVRFDGTVDAVVDPVLVDDVLAVVREGLSNAARHADASAVRLDIAVTGPEVRVHLRDDGRGIGTPTRTSGLTNLGRRAERHAGSFEVSNAEQGGTELRWRARLPS